MRKFGERLKHLRTKKNITQKDMGKLIKISESAIGMYERGEREPSFELIEKIADFFDVSIDYLLGRTDLEKPSINVAGQEIELSNEEYKVFEEMKKHPKFTPMFHDLASNPEKKVRALIKMWEVIKVTLEEDDLDHDEIIED